jgi:hypothetical protein
MACDRGDLSLTGELQAGEKAMKRHSAPDRFVVERRKTQGADR